MTLKAFSTKNFLEQDVVRFDHAVLLTRKKLIGVDQRFPESCPGVLELFAAQGQSQTIGKRLVSQAHELAFEVLLVNHRDTKQDFIKRGLDRDRDRNRAHLNL